jgi:GntR family transcriptional regulator
MIRLEIDRESAVAAHQQLREQITAALHVGRLRPGDRLPSLRQVARRCQVNPKTVLRAYRMLQTQGIIEIRAGSGAVVRGAVDERVFEEHAVGLLEMARRHQEEARHAGLNPAEHLDLLTRLGADAAGDKSARTTRLRAVVLECNGEQAVVFAREITRRLGLQTFPLVLPAEGEASEAILKMADLWLTTDFHQPEVAPRAAEHGRPCMTLRLDPRFPKVMLEAAEKGTVLMIVNDKALVPAFTRALARVGVSDEVRARIRGLEPRDPEAIRREVSRADFVYVSPLCAEKVARLVPSRARIAAPDNLLAPSSIEALRAVMLTFPVALGISFSTNDAPFRTAGRGSRRK